MVAKGQGTQRKEDLVVLGTRRKDDHEVHRAHQCGCGNFNNEIMMMIRNHPYQHCKGDHHGHHE